MRFETSDELTEASVVYSPISLPVLLEDETDFLSRV